MTSGQMSCHPVPRTSGFGSADQFYVIVGREWLEAPPQGVQGTAPVVPTLREVFGADHFFNFQYNWCSDCL